MCSVDQALHALATYPDAIPLGEFPDVIGESPDAAATVLDELLTAGLLEGWESDAGPTLVLTAAAVERLARPCVIRFRGADLRVSPREARAVKAVRQASRRERIRWEERHTTFTDLAAAMGLKREFDLAAVVGLNREFDLAGPDPTGDPADDLVAREALDWLARAPAYRGRPGPCEPRLILGVGFLGWTPLIEASVPCVVCGGRRLSRLEACIGCCSAGGTELVRDAADLELREPLKRDSLGGGIGPAKVKPDRARAAASWFAEIDDHRRRKRQQRKPAPAPTTPRSQ